MSIRVVVLLRILLPWFVPLWWAAQWSFCWLSECPFGGHLILVSGVDRLGPGVGVEHFHVPMAFLLAILLAI